MAPREPDDLFRRFASRGDVAALGELFDVAALQLARVAWHLTHDANEVEDLVQATFLTALGAAREYDPKRPVMPWLLGILANHARNARRAAGRKPVELEVEPLDPRVPELESERRELREAVQHAIEDLPPTYREVVAPWLLEGSRPADIASRTGKPASTVRVQLRRGLELLRNGLPASAAIWSVTDAALGASLARTRAEVLAHAARAAPVATASSLAAAGGLLVSWKLFVSTAAAVVLLGGALWWGTREAATKAASVDAPRAPELERAGESDAVASAANERESVARETSEPSAVSIPSSAPGWWLRVHVEGVSDARTARISTARGGIERDVAGADFELDVSPLFSDRAQAPLEFVVGYDHPDFLPQFAVVDVASQVDLDQAFARERIELKVDLAPKPATLIVRGRVLAPIPEAANEVLVALYELDGDGSPLLRASESLQCASDGSFRVRAAGVAGHALVAALPGFRPITLPFDRAVRGEVDTGESTLEVGSEIRGVVDVRPSEFVELERMEAHLVAARGFVEALPLTRRKAWRDQGNCVLTWLDARFEWTYPTVEHDNAAFRVAGLAATQYVLVPIVKPNDARCGNLDTFQSGDLVQVTAPSDHVFIEVLRSVIHLEFRADGAAATGVGVSLETADSSSGTTAQCPSIDVFWGGQVEAKVRVSKRGWKVDEFVAPPTLGRGVTRVVDLVPEAEPVGVVFVPTFRCAVPAGNLTVAVERLGGDPNMSGVTAVKTCSPRESTWQVDGVLPGLNRVRVVTPQRSTDLSGLRKRGSSRTWLLPLELDVQLDAGSPPIPITLECGGHLAIDVGGFAARQRLRVLDAERQEVDVGLSSFDASTGKDQVHFAHQTFVPPNVRAETTAPLPPGSYTLVVSAEGDADAVRELPFSVRAEEVTEIALDPSY